MTASICPHCNQQQKKYSAMHVDFCPANPAIRDRYRATLEDPARPGALRTKPDYESNRGDLYSGTFLMRMYRCGWPGLAVHFGLTHAQAKRVKINWIDKTIGRIGEEMDEEIAHNRQVLAAAGDIGLPVLRCREVRVGNIVQTYYQIR